MLKKTEQKEELETKYEGEITNGEHIFSVYYKDQIVHENFLVHDVNLVKLDDNANIETLEVWMNWALQLD